MLDLDTALGRCALIAILRGIEPSEAEAIGEALLAEGFAIIEVPLNSPEPFSSIERLSRRFGERALIGAGTVMSPDDVARLADAGGRLVVMPHSDPAVIRATKRRGLVSMPGVATPTEAFAALSAGADALKLFPAEGLPPPVVKAWKAVLPRSARLFPVGGIGAGNMAPYIAAGVAGFGIGSTLFAPGKSAAAVKADAARLVAAWCNATAKPADA